MNNPNIDATLLSVVSKQIMSKTYFMKAVATQIPVINFRAITFDEGLYIIQSNGMTLYEGCRGLFCQSYETFAAITVDLERYPLYYIMRH